jgi:crossover junction endodeoxyribonuclease RusA
MITLSLPYPPSANKLWRSVDGRNIKSADYRRWLSLAASEIPCALRGKITGRCAVSILADRPDNRARDIDNLLKPVLDALKPDKKQPLLKGVIRDDSDVAPLSIDWSAGPNVKAARVHITITPVEALEARVRAA